MAGAEDEDKEAEAGDAERDLGREAVGVVGDGAHRGGKEKG